MTSCGGNTEEAQRWLATAEKLLAARDLQGAKTFAIRARESNPTRTDLADQVLAVSGTLLAGESRVSNTHQHDWYGILRLVRMTRNLDLVGSQYRRFALLLDPARNRLPFADQAFKLVCDAWKVLSDPAKKALYDHELQLSRLGPQGDKQQQNQQQQEAKQTPPQIVRKSPRNKDDKEAMVEERPNLKTATEPTRKTCSVEPTRQTRFTEPTGPSQAQSSTESGTATFWTACPYCYVLYEYPKRYQECTLRCQNCRRAFHAVMITSPPLTGEDTYFCCWGFFPLGFSDNAKNIGCFSSNWSPVSTMFPCPLQKAGQDETKNLSKPCNANASKRSAPPKFFYGDDDVYVELLDSSEEDDDDDADDDGEWEDERRKKAKHAKGKWPAVKNTKKQQLERVKRGNQHVGGKVNVDNGGDTENMNGGSVVQEAAVAGTSSGAARMVGVSGRKQKGSGAKELGDLDLNVEFSNEVEEPPAPRTNEGHTTGNGEEDNIGIGFFEGLDEFLSSLPILSVVADDKVKAS